jgi:hypothetical protein
MKEMQTGTGTFAKATKNTYMYNTNWGVFYIPKAVAEAEGDGSAPTNIKLTFEATD